MSADLLLTFAEGRCALPADLLRSLTKEVWAGTSLTMMLPMCCTPPTNQSRCRKVRVQHRSPPRISLSSVILAERPTTT